MSFLAKMYIHDRIINVLHTNIHLYQQCDPTTHQPNAKTNGGLFQVVIEADEHTDLLNTVISGTMCSGYIRFFKRDGMSKLMDYEFFDAYIIDISTHFNAYSPDPMTDTLTFSPGILRFGDVIYEKWWKVTDLNREEVEPAEIKKNEPEFTGFHFENLEGEIIKQNEINVNDEVFLVVETEDAIGETINIQLTDEYKNYEYKGRVIEGDVLRNIDITGNVTKVKLKAVKQPK